MDNVVLKSATHISPDGGSPLNAQPVASDNSTIDALVSVPLEPVDQTNVDGNFQARMDVNYQAHDVALAAAKANGHEQTNNLKLGKPHEMQIDDGFEHPDKAKPYSSVNKLFLALAIVCFALFLCSLAFIFTNHGGSDRKQQQLRGASRAPFVYQFGDPFTWTETPISEPYFNISHPALSGLVITVSRRGAAITDVLIPYTDSLGRRQNRSIVLKDKNENYHFGAVRFGFDENVNSMNMTNQLPSNYPFLNAYKDDWIMYGNVDKPSRVRFVREYIEVIYEFSSSNDNQFIMKTIVSPPINEQMVVDPTNNIYFNLRGYGDLSTHHLTLGPSKPINIKTGEQMQQNLMMQGQSVTKLTGTTNYFYRLDEAGLGKNLVATLTDDETKTTMQIFSDHAGVIVDPFGVGLSNRQSIASNMSGIRISPKQSPVYQSMSSYGPTLVVYPSQAIHTTWWQFDYRNEHQ
ncbi:unnamed protein product [Adineta ricciae]|uniref:Uncharacterized protein n=1 Tax=Adineta ricciae TaxID=249248 RepID=A0A815YK53_ADIRI|nr:unnamed protein product [Adineta ricciae]